MAIPDYQALLLPVLRHGSAGEVSIKAVTDTVADELQLSTEERAKLINSGRKTVFYDRIQWAKTYLNKAGLIEYTRRAHYRATDLGLSVLSESPASLTKASLLRFEGFSNFVNRLGKSEDIQPEDSASVDVQMDKATPDEALRLAHARIEAQLAADLLARVRASSPAFFEKLVVNLLVAMGYGGSAVSIDRALVGRSGDGGVDGVIDQDPLGLDRVYVQAKRYGEGNSVGAGAIRDFFGSLDRFKAAKGLFVTTSTFTRDAEETAGMLSKRIVMIDGDRLVRLMIRHDVGCRAQEVLVLKRMDDDFFED